MSTIQTIGTAIEKKLVCDLPTIPAHFFRYSTSRQQIIYPYAAMGQNLYYSQSKLFYCLPFFVSTKTTPLAPLEP